MLPGLTDITPQVQYAFVYKALLEAHQTGETVIPSHEMEARYSELKTVNKETGRRKIEEQFMVKSRFVCLMIWLTGDILLFGNEQRRSDVSLNNSNNSDKLKRIEYNVWVNNWIKICTDPCLGFDEDWDEILFKLGNGWIISFTENHGISLFIHTLIIIIIIGYTRLWIAAVDISNIPLKLCLFSLEWASYQIRKITSCACTENAKNVSPQPRLNDPDMHHGTCLTHAPCCMLGSLTCGFPWSRWPGKRNPWFYVSGKRPIERILFLNNRSVDVLPPGATVIDRYQTNQHWHLCKWVMSCKWKIWD